MAVYLDAKAFKLFGLDVGLTGAQAGMESKVVVEGDTLFTGFKATLTEQCVAQALWASLALPPGYWASDRGSAKVNFIIQENGLVIPLEVKSAVKLKTKSLKVLRERFAPLLSARTSLAPYQRQEGLLNLPLYALARLKDELIAIS